MAERAGTGAETPDRKPTQRIAVVFVHGQGEQTPMTDVIELVESVWRTDPRAALKPSDAEDETHLAETYSTPVYDEDVSDQRRIMTREVAGRRVDFYQFYWADLMKGNRFQHLWAWFTALMTRAPDEVPPRIWPIRQTSMFLALGIGVWGAALAMLTSFALVSWTSPGGLIAGVGGLLAGLAQAAGAHMAVQGPANKAKSERGGKGAAVVVYGFMALILAAVGWVLRDTWQLGMFLAFVAGSLILYASLSFWRPPADWRRGAQGRAFVAWLAVLVVAVVAAIGLLVSGGEVFKVAQVTAGKLVGLALLGLAVLNFGLIWSPRKRAVSFELGVLLVLGSLGAALLPSSETPAVVILGREIQIELIRNAAVLSSLVGVAILGAAGWWLNRSFLAPVMTDSARMFSNSPVNIPNQNDIRARGMALLRALHRKGTHGAKSNDDEPPYDRIIVLAHSLGTVVAYRLLAHYWGSVHRGLKAAPRAEVDAIDDAAAAMDPARLWAGSALNENARLAALTGWRAAVRRYWAVINSTGGETSDWRITDFITIGSPLTYASLLMEKKDRDFTDQVEVYKRYPTTPPQPTTPPSGKKAPGLESMFDREGKPHHGAMFAATTWTNLYFPNHGLVRGDMIGGPLHGRQPNGLGPGVLDVDLDHDNSVQGFTHSEYWRWPDRAKRLLRPFGDRKPPPHVAAMRDALNLFDDADADARLVKPIASYPNDPLPAETAP